MRPPEYENVSENVGLVGKFSIKSNLAEALYLIHVTS